MLVDQQRFIDDFSTLMVALGMSPGVGRLYAYLLLSSEPVSLDQIAADLEVSKSNASVATRLLETHMLARRHGERGSKRALYSATDDYAGLVAEKTVTLGKLATLLDSSGGVVAGGLATERLAAMSRFHRSMQQAMEAAMAAFKSR